MFLHEFSGGSKPVLLHPQIICDAMTVVDFGKRFYEQWRQQRN